MSHQHHQKEKEKTTRFFFASKIKTYSAEKLIKDASPWQTASLIIYLNEHNHRHTGEKEVQTLDTGGWHSGSAV